MELITVRELFKNTNAYAGKTIEVGGWVRSVRASKSFGFIVLSDGTYFSPLQVVYHDTLENFTEVSKMNVGAALIVRGTLVETPDAKQPFELQAEEVTVEGASTPDYPLQKKRHTLEYLRTMTHLRPRTNTFQPCCLRDPQIFPGTRLCLCTHTAHHRFRLRGRWRNVPGHHARPEQCPA